MSELANHYKEHIALNFPLSIPAETDPVFLASEAYKFAIGDASKLAGIASGAEVNVNADWNASSGDSQILNKPTIPKLDDGTTAGQIPFWNGSKWTYTETSELFWDDTNKRLGVGTDSPDYTNHIVGELRVQSAAYAGMMLLGADAGVTTVSTNVNKQARIAGVTYGNSYTMGMFSYVSESGRDRFVVGSQAGNTAVAPTEIYLNTALTKGVSGSTVERIKINTARIILDDVLYISRTNLRAGILVNTPTARMHLPAGTATTGTAPLKFTAGTNLTTPEGGTFEYDGTNLFFTTSDGTRHTIV